MKHLSRKHQLLASLCCISLTVCLWLGNITSSTIQIQIGKATNAQNSTSSQLVQEGVKKYQANQYLDAIEDWNKALDIEKNNSNPRNKAIISENLARAYQQVGQTENAIKHWAKVVQTQKQLKDVTKLGHSLTELAQVYTSYGQPKKAIELLCNSDNIDKCQTGSAFQIAEKNQDFDGQVAALGSLGEAYRLFEGCEDDSCRAIKILEKGERVNEDNVQNKNYQIAILNSRANIYINRASLNYRRAVSLKRQGTDSEKNSINKRKEAKDDDEKGLNELDKSLAIIKETGNKLAEIQTLLSKIFVYKRTNPSETQELWDDARKLSKALPKNSQTAYIYIDLADKLQPTVDENALPISLSQCSQELKYFDEAQKLLNEAASIAHQVKDNRAESFSLGKLGKLYECSNKSDKYDIALAYTKQAREVIEKNLAAKDSLLLWEWQAGRILKKQGKIADAVIAYKNSRHTLEKVRQDTISENRNFQFDFRDEFEGIYRELMSLQLNAEAENKENKSNQGNSQDLIGALETLDSLNIRELQNYFGSDCIITIPNDKSKNEQDKFKNKILSIGEDKQTAIFSSIIFEDKTAIILTIPDAEPIIKWMIIDKENLRKKIIDYRRSLQETIFIEHKQESKYFYESIIQPFENYLCSDKLNSCLGKYNIKTLVFVQDSILKNIPMSALLYNDKNFLIEKYAIVNTPSLLLTDNQNYQRDNLSVLALGLSEERKINGQIFDRLKNVPKELRSIPQNITKKLENENFNRTNIKRELSKRIYSVIHIATHGNFGTEPKETFLVTGETETGKEKLTITELDKIIRDTTRRQNRIDLLALTACKTAVGDERSSLGLAGAAIQAGAKSTLASLWSVGDQSTSELVNVFYAGFNNPNLTKAQLLQNAQVELIKRREVPAPPSQWAPFILIGNWK